MLTYRHEKYIRQAIEGVLMQVCDFEIELIIADDRSPDNTSEIVNQLVLSHPNNKWIKYTRHAKNKGMMGNFIWALSKAKSKYIAICDGDDYWIDANKIQKQVDFLEKNKNYNLVCTNSFLDNQIKKKNYFQLEADYTFNFGMQVLLNRCITCTTLFRSNQFHHDNLTQFNNVRIGDIVIWSLVLRNNKLGYFINENTSVYREHIGGVYSQNSHKENTFNELNVLNRLLESELFDFFEKNLIKYKIQIIWYDILHSRYWFKNHKSFLMILKNINLLSFQSIFLSLKAFIRFIRKYCN